MPFIVHSPFDGQPVKVRDEDIGRALRDGQRRIFYAVPRSNGEGYYAAPTRQGGARDEERYDQMMQGTVKAAENVRTAAETVHDATGRRRTGKSRKLVALVVVLILLAVAYYLYRNWDRLWQTLSDDTTSRGAPNAVLVLAAAPAHCPGPCFEAE